VDDKPHKGLVHLGYGRLIEVQMQDTFAVLDLIDNNTLERTSSHTRLDEITIL
jgi:hypothetical protein